ncbi:hypothetical protein [Loktanella salsilacus]|uniref:hypothetical protein n=1 Tax=Loktanella salsilacus TaxID=195913 RepID=UPI00373597DF
MKSILLGATIMLGMATAASADDLYSTDPSSCVYGSGGQGNVSIGNGRFTFGENVFSRVSERVATGNGFYRATYEQIMEGEPVGQVVMSLRITDSQFDVISGDNTVTARRCD